jgi:hypothetical protein
MLFADESRDVPDFWNSERVEVREISICDHAIQLTFTVNERGSPHLAALVFPMPTRGIVETRLGFPFGTPAYAMELAHLERRYASLDVALRSMSGGSLVRGTRLTFDGPVSSDRPVLLAPSRLLALRWNGTELPLRGYLDVYFTLVS